MTEVDANAASAGTPVPPAPEPVDSPPAAGPGPRRRLQAVAVPGTLVVTVLAVFSALVVGAVIIVATSTATLTAWGHVLHDPGRAVHTSWTAVETAYAALFTGALGDPAAYVHAFQQRTAGAFVAAFTPLSETLVDTAPLLLSGLAVALAFRAGMFNIGAQGQIIAGALAGAAIGLVLPGLPGTLHLALGLVGSFAGGAAAGWVPGVLKARTGAHEVITTIMLNYVVLNLLVYLLGLPFFLGGGLQVNAISRPVPAAVQLPHLAGPGLRVNGGIVVALLAAGAVWWLMRRTTLGFRFRLIGASPAAARAAGVDIPKMVTLAFVLAGGLAGLAGGVQVLGVANQLVPNFGEELGFTAIIVALLGRANPTGVVLAALLFGAFQAGGLQMQAQTSIPIELVEVIEAVIVFFIAAPQLVRQLYRIRAQGGGIRLLSQGWGG
ncbi:MAG TPA: ABC transporter permease [Candidatus Micrarchaeia archaeon]|nr:ABC transporter permease [Candidatus Micrarchaeia archaeon]